MILLRCSFSLRLLSDVIVIVNIVFPIEDGTTNVTGSSFSLTLTPLIMS